ncbi:unnamed protein product, partial [Coregonus sp. 'balchen']
MASFCDRLLRQHLTIDSATPNRTTKAITAISTDASWGKCQRMAGREAELEGLCSTTQTGEGLVHSTTQTGEGLVHSTTQTGEGLVHSTTQTGEGLVHSTTQTGEGLVHSTTQTGAVRGTQIGGGAGEPEEIELLVTGKGMTPKAIREREQ